MPVATRRARSFYPPSQKIMGLPASGGLARDECVNIFVLRRDVTPKLRRITASEPKAKTGSVKVPRIYPWGSMLFYIKKNELMELISIKPLILIDKDQIKRIDFIRKMAFFQSTMNSN